VRNAFLIIIFFLASISSNAQIDYLDVQDSLFNLSCGNIPMDDLMKSKSNLETFDPKCLSKNANQYYKNLGYTYYVYAAKTEDYSYMSKAIEAFNKGLKINPVDYNSHWDLAHCYFFNKEYQNCINSMQEYKANVPKKYYDKKGMKNLVKMSESKIKG